MATSSYYTYGTNLRNKEFFTSTVETKDGIKRYFSNIDAEIYFGNENITNDLCEFSFSVEEKKLPVYSYNKFYPDIIIPGQRIVQGTFALNFTDGAYIRNILSKIDNSILNTSYFDEQIYNPSDDSKNKALWNKSFDITIGYGDYKSENPSYNATCQTICGVQIMNVGKAISSKTGEPILEVYSFIGKDFIDKENNEYNTKENNKENESNNNQNNNNSNDNSGNNKEDNKDNNKENNTDKFGIIYNADYEFWGGMLGESINVTLTFPKNMIPNMKTCSIKGTFELIDNNIPNEEYPNASKIFTLERGLIISIENAEMNGIPEEYIKKISYSIKADDSRPIVRALNVYYYDNKNSTIKCNFKYSLTIDGKTEHISKDLNMRFVDKTVPIQ